MAGVVVVGSANVDVGVAVERLPTAGETVLGRSRWRSAGGKGLNQAIAAARAGAAVSFVGAVGDDDDGRALLATLAADGIDVGSVAVVDRPTGLALIATDAAGENQIVVDPAANAAVDAALVDRFAPALASAPVWLTQLEVAPSALAAVRRWAALVVLNPAPARPLAAADLAIDVCVPNATELATLVGVEAPRDRNEAVAAARRLRGPAWVVVTLGPLGAVVVERGGPATPVPAPAGVEVVDTTAAGDALCGYLAAALAAGSDVVEATRWGVRAGSWSVTRRGAAGSIPHRRDLPG